MSVNISKKTRFGLSMMFILCFSAISLSTEPVLTQNVRPDTSHKIPRVMKQCTSDEVGVTFICDPSWKLTRQGKTLKVIISEVPLVEMMIEEIDQKVHFMSELNQEAFKSTGRYLDGFHLEHLTYCNRETIKINGHLKGKPHTRVSDFYLIDHLYLHAVKFTLDPKESWEEYKWLIKKIIDSVAFINHKAHIKLHSEATDETCEELVIPSEQESL